jgi:predicted lipoprotein with Yx(FWY)xxD motif
MTRSRLTTFLACAAAMTLVALPVAGCGGDDNGDTAPASPPKNASGRTATVGVADSDLGRILVDSQGRTLYLFEKDSGQKSACSGACATAWPPLRTTGKPAVRDGGSASLVGTSPRSDGPPQVTYDGHPLYLYEGDSKAGDTNGQGLTAFGGGWFALSRAGKQVSGGSSSPGNGY